MLMPKENYQNIHERIYNFIIRVIKLIKKLPDTPENKVIRYQIAKSVTSMGANDQEADGTISIKDFINKYAIVRKESKETHYWLKLIRDTNEKLSAESSELMEEFLELIKIISSIIYNTKKRSK